jgi:hypothetical protein
VGEGAVRGCKLMRQPGGTMSFLGRLMVPLKGNQGLHNICVVFVLSLGQ